MSVILRDTNFRHKEDGTRMAEILLYSNGLSGLPTSAADIDGLLPDDEIADGSKALDMNTGDVAMFTA